MFKSRFHRAAALAAGIVAVCAAQAGAITNPGFEQPNLSGWQATGQVGTFNEFKGFVDPSEGAQQLIMFTDRFASQPRNAAASTIQLNDALGTSVSGAVNQFVLNGSLLSQTFTVNEPTQVQFDWAFANRADAVSGNDIAFVMLNNEVFILTDLNSAQFTRSGEDAFIATEYSTFEMLPTLDVGTHDITFGVVAVDRAGGRSALLVDNIVLLPGPMDDDPLDAIVDPFLPQQDSGQVDGSFVATPEPGTAALVALAMAAMVTASRRRRDKPREAAT